MILIAIDPRGPDLLLYAADTNTCNFLSLTGGTFDEVILRSAPMLRKWVELSFLKPQPTANYEPPNDQHTI